MVRSEELYDAILNGDAKKAHAATQAALAADTAPMDLIAGSMVPAMDEVGRLFETEEYFVPELLLAGRAMKSAMELLRPLMATSGEKLTTRVVIGTVKGDMHDIGKTSSPPCWKAVDSRCSTWAQTSRQTNSRLQWSSINPR